MGSLKISCQDRSIDVEKRKIKDQKSQLNILGSLAVLGEISISDTFIKADKIAKSLQLYLQQPIEKVKNCRMV